MSNSHHLVMEIMQPQDQVPDEIERTVAIGALIVPQPQIVSTSANVGSELQRTNLETIGLDFPGTFAEDGVQHPRLQITAKAEDEPKGEDGKPVGERLKGSIDKRRAAAKQLKVNIKKTPTGKPKPK